EHTLPRYQQLPRSATAHARGPTEVTPGTPTSYCASGTSLSRAPYPHSSLLISTNRAQRDSAGTRVLSRSWRANALAFAAQSAPLPPSREAVAPLQKAREVQLRGLRKT